VGKPQTQLLKWRTNNKHRKHVKHNINNRNGGNDTNVSMLSNQSKCESTLQGICGNCVQSGKDCICPFILYIMCVSFAVIVVGVDNAPRYGLVVDRAPQPYWISWPVTALAVVQYQWSMKMNATCHNRTVMRLTTNRGTYSLGWVPDNNVI